MDIPFEDIEPQIIEVEGGALPLEIHFKSSSSRIRVHQTHESAGAGEVEQTSSEEEPHRLIHEVKKPIIQEVREIITPYRRVIQEIQPVMEEIHTIVAKGEARRQFDRNQSKTRGGGGSGGSSTSGGGSISTSGGSSSRGSGSYGGSSSTGSSGTSSSLGGSTSSGGGSSFQQTFETGFEQKRY